MDNAPEFFTVFRSEEDTAAEDARKVRDQLRGAGLDAAIYEDRQTGAWEVRVPASQAEQAGQAIAVNQPDWASPFEEVDPSSDLDQVTVYNSETAIGEMEAMSIKALLNAAGIPAFIVGTSTLPVFAFQVLVPREHAEEARRLIKNASTIGAESAEQAQASAEENA